MFGDPGSDRSIHRIGRRASETPEVFEAPATPSSAEGEDPGATEVWADENERGPQRPALNATAV